MSATNWSRNQIESLIIYTFSVARYHYRFAPFSSPRDIWCGWTSCCTFKCYITAFSNYHVGACRIIKNVWGHYQRKKSGKKWNAEGNVMKNLPTTFKYPTWFFIGSVFIWHMYQPLSDSLTSFILNTHARFSTCETVIRWFFVIICVWIDKIVCVSTFSHAICQWMKMSK